MKVDFICIVGGGIVGWMVVVIFIRLFLYKYIIFLESDDIFIIGVGEFII